MIEYETETGFYVLVNSENQIIGKANVPVGTHPVNDDVDLSKSFDVETAEHLKDHVIDA
jgi:hypothetical protein